MSSPFHLRASAVLLAALSLAACTDPMAPVIQVHQGAPAVLLRAATASDLQLCVADALERITPALEQSDDLNKVKSSLLDVAGALEKRSLSPLVAASRSLKDAVDKYMSADENRGLDPDAAVLRILSEDLEAVALFPPLDTIRTN